MVAALSSLLAPVALPARARARPQLQPPSHGAPPASPRHGASSPSRARSLCFVSLAVPSSARGARSLLQLAELLPSVPVDRLQARFQAVVCPAPSARPKLCSSHGARTVPLVPPGRSSFSLSLTSFTSPLSCAQFLGGSPSRASSFPARQSPSSLAA